MYCIVTDLLKALLGNGSVDTFQHVQQYKCFLCSSLHKTVEELYFVCGPQHARVELCFLRGPCRDYITGVCL
jgi:hypothetical protein